jgi:hypothetical protein
MQEIVSFKLIFNTQKFNNFNNQWWKIDILINYLYIKKKHLLLILYLT